MPALGGRFKEDEGIAHTLEKIRAGDFAELRFRIVQVVDVDAFELEIAEAAGDLILEKSRRHAMAAGDDVFRGEDSGLKIFVEKIFVGILGHGTVGREVAAFGADDEFFSGKSFCGELLDGGADVALAALEAVVDGRVDKVDA